MKKCGKCGVEKVETEFHKRTNRPCGYCSKCKTCYKEDKAEYYQNNKEIKKIKHKKYCVEHEEQRKEYRKQHRTQQNEYLKKYRQQRRQNDPLFKFIDNTKCLINMSFKNGGWSKISHTQELLGCSYADFLEYLGPMPEGEIEKDHICPCTQAKTQEEADKLCHYTNFRWLTQTDNLQKSDNWTPEGEEMCRKLLNREWIYS